MEHIKTELKYFIFEKLIKAYSSKKSSGYEQINNDVSQKLLLEVRNQCLGAYEFCYFKNFIEKCEFDNFEKYFDAVVRYFFDDVIDDCISDFDLIDFFDNIGNR